MSDTSSRVQELSDANFHSTLKEQKLAIVDVFASWCGPCRLFSPLFGEISNQYSDVAFYKIDGDLNPGCRANLTIDNLPFIAAYRNGEFVKGVSTTTEEGIREFIEGLRK
jgi:thioredoxin-like negative regulator of GroEL